MTSPDPIAAERAHYLALLGRTVDDPAVTLAELRSMTGAGVDVRSAAEAKITEQRMVAGSAFVRSVNGINPDINGNVTVAGSSSELSGTGFPGGVVTATPGTYYTDTAGTNGAWRWLKTSGTGNTGWECVIGDTGWRNITADLLNGWTATSIKLRRTHAAVYWDVLSLTGNAAFVNVINIPAGFGTGSSYNLYVTGRESYLTGNTVRLSITNTVFGNAASQTKMIESAWNSATYALTCVTQYASPVPWPTVLPGTAA